MKVALIANLHRYHHQHTNTKRVRVFTNGTAPGMVLGFCRNRIYEHETSSDDRIEVELIRYDVRR
ncbi:hypothetical protein ARMGADRAFT_288940 [Armillaria gallica]|uniref:Uncharacterized protein n=1 Tax=Armillaria gallica TaxID=47427 RepID=A0A2H3D5Z5_ARMGA|nr:hypothetical protein ARMGADRAFT_288940 [Armillaria gallica]